MWSWLLERCADLFGVTTTSRLGQLVLACTLLFVGGVAFAERWGAAGLVLPALFLGTAILAARRVLVARDRLWRAACGPIANLDAVVGVEPALAPATALSLHFLAAAVADARLDRLEDAIEALNRVERGRLRMEELHLLEAVRALVSLGLGDTHRAARQAIGALPTGSDELDSNLGRTLVTDAWNDRRRLSATLAAWQRAGIGAEIESPLGKLERLVRVRVDPRLIDEVRAADARPLADEARAIGDEELASELDARARASAYR